RGDGRGGPLPPGRFAGRDRTGHRRLDVEVIERTKNAQAAPLLAAGGMRVVGGGVNARCQTPVGAGPWQPGPPTHTPCRLRYALPRKIPLGAPQLAVGRKAGSP